jgi:HKD family nuclease
MRRDLLKIISGSKDVTNAIILTHNIDFVFLQTVVLSAFRKCGQPTVTVFADADCAVESYTNQYPVLSDLGVRYRVVQVSAEPGFRFHPKAILLSGPDEATLLVGSGNLTYGGWRENAEIWIQFNAKSDDIANFFYFRDYLRLILDKIHLADSVRSEVEEAFDPKSKNWISEGSGELPGITGRFGNGPSLIEKIAEKLNFESLEELHICSPYFDNRGNALREVITRFDAKNKTELYWHKDSNLTEKAWMSNENIAKIRSVKFEHQNANGEFRSAFMHAKFYAFLQKDQVIVVAGSGNCSQGALTIPGKAGNAELMAFQTMALDEYQENYANEFILSSEEIQFHESVEIGDDTEQDGSPEIRVMSARFDSGAILVGFIPVDTRVEECRVNDEPVHFDSDESGIVRIPYTKSPRTVQLRGSINGLQSISNLAWVDQEKYLRSSARGRSLADSIRTQVNPDTWNAGAWSEILGVFCKHLSYMPASVDDPLKKKIGKNTDKEPLEFTADDVFSSGYQMSGFNSLSVSLLDSNNTRVQSLQQLLKRWFGMPDEEISDDTDPDDEPEDDEDVVDRPEIIRKIPRTEIIKEAITDRDRRRICNLMKQMKVSMTSREFLEERSPEMLAADIKIVSVLLCIGLRENWVSMEEFWEVTYQIWVSLFFTSDEDPKRGWFELRFRNSDDPESFIESMKPSEIAAAFLGWVMAVPGKVSIPEQATFKLASVLAVARLPWLWHSAAIEDTGNELMAFLAHSAPRNLSKEKILQRAINEWKSLLRRGDALRRFENAVKNRPVKELMESIKQPLLNAGELLWQGSSGFCITKDTCQRVKSAKLTVEKLQIGEEKKFCATFTIPIQALLDDRVLPITPEFGSQPRQALKGLLNEVERGFAVFRKQEKSEEDDIWR